MKKIYLKYITTLPISILIVTLLAIIYLALYESLLKNIPEFVPWGSELGVVMYRLSLAMISSFIFYFLVVHLKKIKDKENLKTFLYQKVTSIVIDCERQISEMKSGAGYTIDGIFLEKHQVQQIFSKITPLAKSPLVQSLSLPLKHANWMQYLDYHRIATQKNIQKIFLIMHFLDSNLVKLLSDIDDCSHFNTIEQLPKTEKLNKTLKAWADPFYEYSVLCMRLKNYRDSNLL